jgi:hypothetical protein
MNNKIMAVNIHSNIFSTIARFFIDFPVCRLLQRFKEIAYLGISESQEQRPHCYYKDKSRY